MIRHIGAAMYTRHPIKSSVMSVHTSMDLDGRVGHILKHGDTFLVIDSRGDIGTNPGSFDGLFHFDTRFLSCLAITMDGVQPVSVGSYVYDDNSVVMVQLANPDIFRDGQLAVPRDTVHIVRAIFLWHGTAYQRLALRNYGDRPVYFHLAIIFQSDFSDLFEFLGNLR